LRLRKNSDAARNHPQTRFAVAGRNFAKFTRAQREASFRRKNMKNVFLKKKKRPRQVPTLEEREKLRNADKPKTPPRSYGGKIVPFDPNAPLILESKDTRYTIFKESVKNFPWVRLTITLIVILIGGVGSAAFQARNANLRRDINRAERQFRNYQTENFRLEQMLQDRFTFHEIETAAERLGMTHPDSSQIIYIDVPRMGGVTLNTAEYALPQHNYFWDDVSNFFSGLINQIFGGD
jgi:cell division protein FtsL